MSDTRRPSERSVLLLLAAVQFTHIMDFMVMMPLGPQLMRELAIGPERFSGMVAAYTFSAGVIGLLSAPFVDRFDRRKLLLFCYSGFIIGTLACAISHSAVALTNARILCGAFGGVSGALVMAIISDIVPPARRAAGMGIVMTSFSVAAALGVPLGLYLAQRYRWEAPFFVVGGAGVLIWLLLWRVLPPVRDHLEASAASRSAAFMDLLKNANAGRALIFIFMLVIGHMIMVPLLSPYLVHNLGLPEPKLFLIYLVGGLLTIVTSPLVGKLADRHGRVRILAIMIAIAAVVVLTISHAPPLPVVGILVLGGFFFVFASGRFVPAQAIASLAVPPAQRGAFMSLNTCVRDIGAGAAASLAGFIVTTAPDGQLLHYDRISFVAVTASVIGLWLGKRVQTQDLTPTHLREFLHPQPASAPEPQ